MPPDRADQRERDHRHDDDRFDIAFELKAEDQENPDQAEQHITPERAGGVGRLPGLALKGDADARKTLLQARQKDGLRIAQDFRRVGKAGIDVALDGDRAQPVDAVDAGPAAAAFQRRHGAQRHLRAARQGHRKIVKIGKAVAVALGQADIDFVGLGPDLDVIDLAALEGGAKLRRDIGRRPAKPLGPGLQPHPDLGLAGTQVVGQIDDALEL